MYTLISFYIQLQVHPFEQVSPKQRLHCRERNTIRPNSLSLLLEVYSGYLHFYPNSGDFQ